MHNSEGGFVEISNDSLNNVLELFSISGERLIEKGLRHEEVADLPPDGARLKVRRMVMSVCLAKTGNIPFAVEMELFKQPLWLKVIDLHLFCWDAREMTDDELKPHVNLMLQEIQRLGRDGITI